MVETQENGKNIHSEDFDATTELATIVAQNILPSKIAERLERKLMEKQIKITKDQLYNLVKKIRSILDSPTNTKDKAIKTTGNQQSENMRSLVDHVEKICQRLDRVEHQIASRGIPQKKNQEQDQPTDYGNQMESSAVNPPTIDQIEVEPIMTTGQIFTIDPLTKIPSDPESVIILMKWLQYLIDKCGRSNLSEILDYYVDVEWISEDAKMDLLDYSNGITEIKQNPEMKGRNITELPSKDHIQSYLFIQKLKGKKFDKHFVERVEGEIARLTRIVDKQTTQ